MASRPCHASLDSPSLTLPPSMYHSRAFYHLLHPLATSKTFTAPSRTLTAPFHTLAPLQHILAPSCTFRTLSHLLAPSCTVRTLSHLCDTPHHLTPWRHLLAAEEIMVSTISF
ncbi:hypothetical protein M405DRAFT_814502, partial [Rhizopogon salebrosus TDB-379]